MVKFECNSCGKCCRSFGEFIRIERQLTSRDYYCRYGITNELFLVHVQPEFAEEISADREGRGTTAEGSSRGGCIFSRKNPDGPGFLCAIYPTRPAICREFRCYRMLVYHAGSGELRGKVLGINELKSTDPDLVRLWTEKVSRIPHPVHSRHGKIQHSHGQGAHATHGHDAHILAHIHDNMHPADDQEWVKNVVALLAAHRYHGEPVED